MMMKRLIHSLSTAGAAMIGLSFAVGVLTSCGGVAAGSDAAGEGTAQEKMLIGGSFWNTVAVVNRSAGDSIGQRYTYPRPRELTGNRMTT
ncbi:MAG: hypothetical protein K2K83_02395, partial [Rikenella sp.]|nr:hypothetical protein [Rikenella sp.]